MHRPSPDVWKMANKQRTAQGGAQRQTGVDGAHGTLDTATDT